MFELIKIVIRTYLYWLGLLFGFAIAPGNIFFTIGIAPANTRLWLAPIAGLLLLVIDPPSTWNTPVLKSALIRLFGAGCAVFNLISYDIDQIHMLGEHGIERWAKTVLSYGIGWLLFAATAGFILHHCTVKEKQPLTKTQTAIRTIALWHGIWLGIFFIAAAAIVISGFVLGILPLYGIYATGLILFAIDPPQRWQNTQVTTFLIKLASSATAGLSGLICDVFFRSIEKGMIIIVAWKENLTLFLITWGIYAVATGITYLNVTLAATPTETLSK